jgi:hypothetical protein
VGHGFLTLLMMHLFSHKQMASAREVNGIYSKTRLRPTLSRDSA